MAYRLQQMTMQVEALGATWHWVTPDRTVTRMGTLMRRLGLTSFDTDAMPDEIAELLPAMFVEGVVNWEGVVDAAGEPIPCTESARSGVPTGDKLAVAAAYLSAVNELNRGKAPSAARPTTSTPPAPGSPADGTPSSTMMPSGAAAHSSGTAIE